VDQEVEETVEQEETVVVKLNLELFNKPNK